MKVWAIRLLPLYCRLYGTAASKVASHLFWLSKTLILVCRDIQEVVSLGDKNCCAPSELPAQTGLHLRPKDWHQAIQAAEQDGHEPPILLDTRNIYETSIGHFSAVSIRCTGQDCNMFQLVPNQCTNFLQTSYSLSNQPVLMPAIHLSCQVLGTGSLEPGP